MSQVTKTLNKCMSFCSGTPGPCNFVQRANANANANAHYPESQTYLCYELIVTHDMIIITSTTKIDES